jgi:hypothetical protein
LMMPTLEKKLNAIRGAAELVRNDMVQCREDCLCG